jgi:hypothetical protein
MWHVYYRGGRFFLPITARTEAGYLLDTAPVRVVERADPNGLLVALRDVIFADNPNIPAPNRADFPKPVVLVPAGVKSWATFEKKSVCWTITRKAGRYEVAVTGRGADGRWIDDPAATVNVGREASVREVRDAIVAHLEARQDV